MKASLHPYRRVLLAAAASVAALAGGMLPPTAASAQPADTSPTPTITLALSPATVDYGHQNVTASGTVTTSTGPDVGAAVTVSYVDVDGQSEGISLITGNDGSYSGTLLSPETAAQQVSASVAATSSTAAASTSAQLGFTQDAVTITASFAPQSVNPGSTDTLSGVATYLSGDLWYPLANSPITITSPGDSVIAPVSATVTTAADGSFSYVTTPAVGSAAPGVFFTVSSAATPYLGAAQFNTYEFINKAAQVIHFRGTINADRVLRFSAC